MEEKGFILNRCGKLEFGIVMIYGKNGKLIVFSYLAAPCGFDSTISKLELGGYSSTQEVKNDGYNIGI